MIILITSELKKRFWDRIDLLSGFYTGCWIWVGGKITSGYGVFYPTPGFHIGAHVLSYLMFNGKVKHKLQVLHKCDNKSCVNPKHLFIGTNRDNQIDYVNKGKHFKKNKTHCKYGHEYTLENTRSNSKGHRWCKICDSIYNNSRFNFKVYIQIL